MKMKNMYILAASLILVAVITLCEFVTDVFAQDEKGPSAQSAIESGMAAEDAGGQAPSSASSPSRGTYEKPTSSEPTNMDKPSKKNYIKLERTPSEN